MITDSVAEPIVGINRDPQFGPYLLIGSGGILVELIGDSQVLLLPTTATEVKRALQTLRIYPLLQGYRGCPAGDVEATIAAIQAVANFAIEHSATLLELDINPLIVRRHGQGVVAADALIRIIPQQEHNRS